MAKNYEMLTQRAENILKWLPEKIQKKYDAADEHHYGHLFVYHFERDSKYLKERCLREHKNSTAFFARGDKGQSLLKDAVLHTLLDEINTQDISFWLADPQDFDTLEIEVESDTPVGHGYAYIDGKAVHKITKTFLIVLVKSSVNDFEIMTVYPRLYPI